MDDTCETPSRMLGNRLRRLQLKVKRNILLNPRTQAGLGLDVVGLKTKVLDSDRVAIVALVGLPCLLYNLAED